MKMMDKKTINIEARKVIKKWKDRLGFSAWKINARVTIFKRKDNFPQDGDVVINYSRRRATILIGTILKSSLEKIIVHELVHLILWPLDQKVMSAIKQLPKQKQSRVKNNFLGVLERIVGHITESFLRLR